MGGVGRNKFLPPYFVYSARVVLCAATHGLPAASRMSHGPSNAAAAVAKRARTVTAVTQYEYGSIALGEDNDSVKLILFENLIQ